MSAIIERYVLRPIFAIPLGITKLAARMVYRFFKELFEIGLWRAKWYVAIIFWLMFAYMLVSLDPIVKQSFGPIYAVYWRLVGCFLLLAVVAYRTANMRRRWRRSKIEIQLLHRQRGGGGRKSSNNNNNGKAATIDELKRAIAHNEARGDPVPQEWYDKVAKAEKKEATTQAQEPEHQSLFAKFRAWNVRNHTHQDTYTYRGPKGHESYEVTEAMMKAQQRQQEQDLLSGKAAQARREPWSLGLDKKPRRHGIRKATNTEPPQKTRMPTQVQRNTIEVGDNLEFDGSFLGPAGGSMHFTGEVVRIVNDPVTGTPTPIVRDKHGKEWVVGTDRTIYRHWK